MIGSEMLGAEIGVISGAVIASAIDAGLLGWEGTPAPKEAAARTSTSTSTIAISPSFGPVKGGLAAGVHGTF